MSLQISDPASPLQSNRIRHSAFQQKVTSAEEAVKAIGPGDTVAVSGFASAGTPKAVIPALADRIHSARAAGANFTIDLLTGASVSTETEKMLAEIDGIALRMPYQAESTARQKINQGRMDYVDIHLSHVAQQVWEGYYGVVNVAVVEVSGITETGELIPSASVGNNKTWLDVAEKVILEVNSWVPDAMDGIHDIYYGTALPPHRRPIELTDVEDRIGQPHYRVDPAKVVAVVETNAPDSASALTAPDAVSEAIAAHVLDFFDHEVRRGRLPENTLLPLQAGIGNVANAVLGGLDRGPYRGLTCYSEVIQDGMLHLLKHGTVRFASATALALSEAGIEELTSNIDFYRQHIRLRPQEISNHPEVVRRLGIIAMNGMLEADVYGNVNSTHVMGTKIMNGIGGSGDFARNGYLSMFLSPSTAKNGAISSIVPMTPHVDHTEHDTQVLVTEQGLADLRGLSPRRRARVIIERCAHPEFRPLLTDYVERATATPGAGQTPHLLGEAFSFHQRYIESGSMRLQDGPAR
ncbi:acetyl-CoA hydrolase/succinyl-CoA:acetate CoA-transferase [Rhodococcus percolatus]|nr:acetyl-CoA hydrolase/succinyl-CoA:acetate CoA-transferase [Rhodococcus opacus]MBP2204077.1 acetyl-CoA hydrolase/succinyl-CoA:acetate CoA-transferase [Rhodococcus opacus]